jgi:Tfp pilus assembly ATPase PilU
MDGWNKLSAAKKVMLYSRECGTTYLDSYYELVDMGEIKESETLRRKCENGTLS